VTSTYIFLVVHIYARKLIRFPLQADLKRMDTSLKATNQQIENLEKQIAAENLRMAAHSQAKHEETQRRIEEAREAVTAAESALDVLRVQQRDQVAKNEALKVEGMAADRERIRLQENIQGCQAMIDRSIESERNSLIPYGRGIKEVLERIGGMNWVGDTPLGPLGVHVKAKDAKTWGDLLRGQLGGYLTAFAVTDARDRKELKTLLERSGKYVNLPIPSLRFHLTVLRPVLILLLSSMKKICLSMHMESLQRIS
jgi:chromosome segregation ATPase